jgi:hypothetical protein
VGFLKIDSIKFSPYIQKCLNELEIAREYETDSLLVHLVRIQHITERISHLNARDDGSDEVAVMPRTHLSAYISSFQAEIDKLHSTLPKSLRTNSKLCYVLRKPGLFARRIYSHSHSTDYGMSKYGDPTTLRTANNRFDSANISVALPERLECESLFTI